MRTPAPIRPTGRHQPGRSNLVTATTRTMRTPIIIMARSPENPISDSSHGKKFDDRPPSTPWYFGRPATRRILADNRRRMFSAHLCPPSLDIPAAQAHHRQVYAAAFDSLGSRPASPRQYPCRTYPLYHATRSSRRSSRLQKTQIGSPRSWFMPLDEASAVPATSCGPSAQSPLLRSEHGRRESVRPAIAYDHVSTLAPLRR